MGFCSRLGERPNTWKHFGPAPTQVLNSVISDLLRQETATWGGLDLGSDHRGHCSSIDGVLAYINVPPSNLGFQIKKAVRTQRQEHSSSAKCMKNQGLSLLICQTNLVKPGLARSDCFSFLHWRVIAIPPRRVGTEGFRTQSCTRFQGAPI
jgi:hypothetical protein